ncbi:MAG: DUF2141 domain-containing protein [Reichenbachiella sp.]|uniref:DUF2141 domain-containing protein n=1 Tax=Reichenbachiella sp. TaxID=2184521 RepID=UPI0032996170
MKKSILTVLGIVVATISMLAADNQNELTVVIKNMQNTEGVLEVTLFDSEGNWLKEGKKQQVSIDNQSEMKIAFKDLPAGNYAVTVIHDANANGELDTGAFGIPTEAYGFSNDARGMFGPADFDDSQFELNGNTQIEINIK